MRAVATGVMFALMVAAIWFLTGQCAAPDQSPDAPGIELDMDIDRAKPRKTLTPKPAPKVSAKAPAPKVSMVKPQAPKPAQPKR